MNLSGLKPSGRAVLVMPYEPEVRSSVIEIPMEIRKNMQQVEQRAVVVALGASVWNDERFLLFGIPLWRNLRAKVGDKVLVAKYAGYMAEGLDGKPYRLVNDRDVFCVITGE